LKERGLVRNRLYNWKIPGRIHPQSSKTAEIQPLESNLWQIDCCGKGRLDGRPGKLPASDRGVRDLCLVAHGDSSATQRRLFNITWFRFKPAR
jgi:hypothetical protein